MKRYLSFIAVPVLAQLLACAGSEISERAAEPTPVDQWARGTDFGPVSLSWLAELGDSDIPAFVSEALEANFALEEQRERLEDLRQAAIVAGAGRWPSLTASLGTSRRGTESDLAGSQNTGTDYDLDAALNWELDIWGRLSAATRAALLDYEAGLARYEGARRELAATVASLSYEAIAARQLLELFERRLVSLQTTYEIVDGSYRRGLGDALDVYLAQNALEQQRETVANQQQVVLEATTNLQLSLGRYPDGYLPLPAVLPLNQTAIPVGLPAELVTRRQDIAAAWLDLLAADARVAVAHKNRFPRLSLSASGGTTSRELSELVGSDARNWAFTSSLAQPLFAGGSLRAAELQARARTQAQEQRYLGLIYSAFAEVENAISRALSLGARYDALLKAESNARAALELALEQYQRGLVPFTTVLEAQRRSFDTGTSLVRVQNQLVQNRVTLYRSLGGEFVLDE